MAILFTKKMYSPALCGRNPAKIFVFGDNTEGKGKGGQACIRDCPNALGVATKTSPTMQEKAFFEERHALVAISIVALDLYAVEQKLQDGHKVVIPLDEEGNISLGLGLAELNKRAPSVYKFICDSITTMGVKYGVGSF